MLYINRLCLTIYSVSLAEQQHVIPDRFTLTGYVKHEHFITQVEQIEFAFSVSRR